MGLTLRMKSVKNCYAPKFIWKIILFGITVSIKIKMPFFFLFLIKELSNKLETAIYIKKKKEMRQEFQNLF